MGRWFSVASLCLASLSSAVLTGCSAGMPVGSGTVVPAGSSPLGQIQGRVQGGRQPILNASIYVYQASTTGYGGAGLAATSANASTSLLTSSVPAVCGSNGTSPCQDANGNYYVVTDSRGAFSLTGNYACTAGAQVYLYSTGGDPGSGVNSAAGLMALLGTCPSDGTKSMAGVTPFVFMSELSTVAAAYAVAGFSTDPLHIGSTGSTAGIQGLKNAFANSTQLYRLDGSYGLGGSALPTTPGTGTNGVTGTVPQSELNTLANILASCVNSAGLSSYSCTTLFRNATNDGVLCAATCADEPTDTAGAAINLAHFSYANTATLYGLQPTAVPYQPTLSAAPNDFSVAIVYTGGGITFTNEGGATQPHSIAVDASGNIWTANPRNGSGHEISEFSPLGVPANSSGFTGVSTYNLGNIVMDATSSTIYISGERSSALYKYTIATNTSTNTSVAPSGLSSGTLLTDVEIDASGSLWASDRGNNALIQLNSAMVPTAYFTGNSLNSPWAVAVQPSTGELWLANANYQKIMSVFSDAGAAVATPTSPSITNGQSLAFDAAGVGYVAMGGGLLKIPANASTPSAVAFSGAGSLDSLAIDGAGNAWVSDTSGYIWTLPAGTTTGHSMQKNTAAPPDGLAVDGSGNVWYQCYGGANTLTEIVGAAVPVVTPLTLAVQNSTLGKRP